MERFIPIILITLFTAYFANAQNNIVKGNGICYTNGVPTVTINTDYHCEFAIDTSTGKIYVYGRDTAGGKWIHYGWPLRETGATGSPSYTPGDKQSFFAVNLGDSLYFYGGGSWGLVSGGGGSDGNGIYDGSGTVPDLTYAKIGNNSLNTNRFSLGYLRDATDPTASPISARGYFLDDNGLVHLINSDSTELASARISLDRSNINIIADGASNQSIIQLDTTFISMQNGGALIQMIGDDNQLSSDSLYLSFTGGTLEINASKGSNGQVLKSNGYSFDWANEGDGSTTNEIQSLTATAGKGTLRLDLGGGSVVLNDSSSVNEGDIDWSVTANEASIISNTLGSETIYMAGRNGLVISDSSGYMLFTQASGGSGISSNVLSLSGNTMTSNINSGSYSDTSLVIGEVNGNLSGNTQTINVNDVTDTMAVIGSNVLTFTSDSIKSTINGINSNAIYLGGYTNTDTQDLSITAGKGTINLVDGGNVTLNDSSSTNEGIVSFTVSANTGTLLSNTFGQQPYYFGGRGILQLTDSSGYTLLTATEGDGSTTNEGLLSWNVSANLATLTSNTSGSETLLAAGRNGLVITDSSGYMLFTQASGGSGISSNVLSLSGNTMTSNINSGSYSDTSLVIGTNVLASSGNTLTSTINGVANTGTGTLINSLTTTFSSDSIKVTANGINSTASYLGGTYHKQGGNSYGATFNVGTNDNNTVNIEVQDTAQLTLNTDGTSMFTTYSSTNNALIDGLYIDAESYNTPTTSFGGSLMFKGKSSTTAAQQMATIGAYWTNATHANREAALTFQLGDNAGSLAEVFKIDRSYNNTGTLYIGSSSALTLYRTAMEAAAGFTILTPASSTLTLQSANAATAAIHLKPFDPAGSVEVDNVAYTSTSLAKKSMVFDGLYTAASGSGTMTALAINNTYNLTSTASGAQIGIDINPTLTSLTAATYRGINIPYSNSAAYGIYQSGASTLNYFAGETQYEKQLKLKEISAPSTPASGYGYLYAFTDDSLYYINNAGTSINLCRSSGSGGSYTDENAQDAIGSMINASLQYVDGTPLLAINDRDFGDITTSGSGLTFTIDASTITTSKILDSTITEVDLATNSVGANAIKASAVGTSEINDGTIATADLADSLITEVKLITNSVGSNAIKANAVGTSEINDGSITGDDLSTTLTITGNTTFGNSANDLTLSSISGANEGVIYVTNGYVNQYTTNGSITSRINNTPDSIYITSKKIDINADSLRLKLTGAYGTSGQFVKVGTNGLLTFGTGGGGASTNVLSYGTVTGILTSVVDGISDTTAIPLAAADGATMGIASFTAADFNSSAGNISIDYTNGQAASGSNKGFLTSSDWTTFNNKDGSTTNEGLVSVNRESDSTVYRITTNTTGSETLWLKEGTNISFSSPSSGTGTDTLIISASGGGSLSDGDYGDVVVSSSGTVMTVDNDAITSAKIAANTINQTDVDDDFIFINGGNITGNVMSVGTNDAFDFSLKANATNMLTVKSAGGIAIGGGSGATSTAYDWLTFNHTTSGTVAAGFGTNILFNLESSTTDNQPAANIAAVWSDATHATRKGDLVFSTVNSSSTLNENLRIAGNMSKTFTASVSNTNTVFDQLVVRTNSTGTAAASFGTGILFQGESSTTDNRDMVSLQSYWTTATDATREAAMGWKLGNAGSAGLLEVMKLDRVADSSGVLSVGYSTPLAITRSAISGATAGGLAITGGTAVTDSIIFKGTTGNGTATNGALIFNVGNNGATNAMTIRNNGNIGIGNSVPASALDIVQASPSDGLGILRISNTSANANNTGLTFSSVNSANTFLTLKTTTDAGIPGVILSDVTSGTAGTFGLERTTSSVLGGTRNDLLIYSSIDGRGIIFGTKNTTLSAKMAIVSSGYVGIGVASPTGQLEVKQTATATGALKGIVFTGAVNTNQTLSTEIPSLYINAAGRQWATGALTTQREVLVTQPTYSFVGASTITDAATVGIAGAPIKSTNATITNTHGLLIGAGAVSTATNSYGLTVNAQTGATNNYAAQFLGGNVGIRSSGTNIKAYLQIGAGTATAGTAPLCFVAGPNTSTAVKGEMNYDSSYYLTKESALRFGVGGTIKNFYSDAANSGTSETDLYSYTTPANTLGRVGETIEADFYGQNVHASATMGVRVYFAGTQIHDYNAAGVQDWTVHVCIVRTGSTTARAAVTFTSKSNSSKTTYTSLTGLTLSNTNILKITGQSTVGSNDVVATIGAIKWYPGDKP